MIPNIEAIAEAINKAFGRNILAQVENDEFILQIGNHRVWINFAGEITGESHQP